MQDKSSYLLAADSEVEMEDWVAVLNKILQLNFEAAMQERRNGDPHDGRPPHLSRLCTGAMRAFHRECQPGSEPHQASCETVR